TASKGGALAETRRTFDQGFRDSAVRLVRETGEPIAHAARELGISARTLGSWVNAKRRRGSEGNAAPGEAGLERLALVREEVPALAADDVQGSPPSAVPLHVLAGQAPTVPLGRVESPEQAVPIGAVESRGPTVPTGGKRVEAALDRAVASMPGSLRANIGALALIAVLVPLHSLWAAQLLLVPLLLVVPGAILLQALRVPRSAVSSFPVYVPCASLVVLLGSGLAVDVIGPLVGVTAPIRAGPLLVGLEVVCLALLAVTGNAPSSVALSWRSLAPSARLAWPLILPLGLPLIAAAGALRLNNGHGALVAVIA